MKHALAALVAFVLGVAVTRTMWSATEPRAAATEPAATPGAEVPAERARTVSAPAPLQAATGFENDARFDELEALVQEVLVRLDDLERRLTASLERRPATLDAAPAEDDLRRLVEEVLSQADAQEEQLAEERELEAELRDDAQFHAEIRFQIGMATAQLAKDLSLSTAQRDELTEALIELETSRRDMQRDLDPLTSDPETWQARFESLETEFWTRLDRTLGPELVEELRRHF